VGRDHGKTPLGDESGPAAADDHQGITRPYLPARGRNQPLVEATHEAVLAHKDHHHLPAAVLPWRIVRPCLAEQRPARGAG